MRDENRSSVLWTILCSTLVIAIGISLASAADAHADPAHKKVAILIFDDVQVIDYSGPLEVLSDAGFDVFTVASNKDPVRTSAGDAVKLTPKYTFADAPQADLIVIPGGGYEAPKDSAAVAWIKKEAVQAEHIMSVCNGAFTLANTGLLDGLSATTTAGNINRFRKTYPQIHVAMEKRVVDNGKIIATAGLSAGIDGALHMVDVMKGPGAGQSVALATELDWRPDQPFVRAIMADRLIPSVYRTFQAGKVSDPLDYRNNGNKDHWERTVWYLTSKTPVEIFVLLKRALEQEYASDYGAWMPGSFKLQTTGPLTANIQFDERDGQHWHGTLAVETQAETDQVAWQLSIDRLR